MSSLTPGSSNSSRYLDFDEYVELKLQKTGASIKTTDILIAAAGVATMFLTYLLAFIVFDQWIIPGGFGIGLRWTLLVTLLVLTAAWLTWKVGIPYLRTVNKLFAAREIEAADPDLRSNLLNLVDLRAAGREVNPAVLRTLEKNAAVQLQKIDVTQAIDHRPLMRMAYALLAVVLLFCLYALFSPKKISNSIWRSLFPAAEVGVATRTEILKVEPGNVTVMARQPVEIKADIAGEVPEKVWLEFTTADGKFRNEPVTMQPETPTRFVGSLLGENGLGLLQDTTYVVRAGDAVSQTYTVTVNQPPSANVDKIAYRFEPYTKLEPTEQAGGNIEAWEGTTVTVFAHMNIPVKSATIKFRDEPTSELNHEEESMSVSSDGMKLTASWKLAFRSDGRFAKVYEIECKTESGMTDPKPTQYSLNIRPDLPPEVALLEPVRDMEVAANAIIPLLIEARDPDFELSHINLHIKKNGQPISKEPLSDGRQQRVLLKHDLNLDRLVLKAGDVVEFHVQAFDNKQPRPNSTVTPGIKLKIVERMTDREVQQKLAEDRVKRDEKLEEAKRDQNGERPEQQPRKEGKPGEDRKDPATQPQDQPKENSENKTEQGKADQTNPGQEGKSEGKSEAGKGKNGNEKKPADGAGNSPENSQKENGEKLSPDGDDDPNALKKVIEQYKESLNKRPKPEQSDPNNPANGSDSKSEPSEDGNDSKSEPKSGPKKPNDASDSKSQETEPGGKTDTAQKNKKPGDPNPTDPMKDDPAADPSSGTKPNEADPRKQGPKTPDPMKNGPGKNGNDTQPGSSEDKTENAPGSTPKPGSPDQTSGTEDKPGPGTEPEKNTAGGQEKTNPKSKTPEGPGAEGDMPENKPGANEKDPAESEKPAKPSKNKTEGKPAGNEKPAEATNSDSKSPMKSGPEKTGPEKNANGTDTEMPAEDSPDAQQKKANGDEKGLAKPNRDPKADPTQSKNPGELNRDPHEKPETRPGNSKANDPNNPAKTPSDTKVKNPKPTEQGQEKIQQEQDTEGKPGQGTNKKPDSRPGDQNAKDEELKGPGQKDQRSKTGSGGEEGSSKEDKNGKPGSPNSGEGSETDRPGEQQPGKETNDKDSSNSKQAGSGKEGTGGEKKPGGEKTSGKSGAGQKGAGGKPESGEKPQGGEKQDGGEKAPGAEGHDSKDPSSKSQGGEPGDQDADGKGGKEAGKPKEGGKPGQGGAGGQGGKNPQGGSGTGKQGPRGPVDSDGAPANGASSSSVDDGEEANLEFNRQATELVLKQLEKDLERGTVDPELLKKLGWTEEQTRAFYERINKGLQESKSGNETPESQSRRAQFEEMLKSMDLNRKGAVRSGENSPTRDVQQIDARRTTVPKKYDSVYKKFSSDVTRQKTKPAK